MKSFFDFVQRLFTIRQYEQEIAALTLKVGNLEAENAHLKTQLEEASRQRDHLQDALRRCIEPPDTPPLGPHGWMAR